MHRDARSQRKCARSSARLLPLLRPFYPRSPEGRSSAPSCTAVRSDRTIPHTPHASRRPRTRRSRVGNRGGMPLPDRSLPRAPELCRRPRRVGVARPAAAALAALLLLICPLLSGAAPVAQDGVASPAATAILPARPVPTGLHWRSPVPRPDPPEVLRAFQAPPQPWRPGHRGVDLAADEPTVLAPADGTVRFVGSVAGRPVVSLEHPGGVISAVEPVSGSVSEGQAVRAGQPIGTVELGSQHCERTCVHLGVRLVDGWRIGTTVRDRYLDPSLLIGVTGPSVLWPLEGTAPAPTGGPGARPRRRRAGDQPRRPR